MEQPSNDLETGHPYWFGSLASFFAAASICAALYCVLVTKSLPTQDDFCRAAAVPVTIYPPKVFPVGIIVSVVWSYHNWSARWAGIGLETLLLRFIRLPEFYPVLLLLLAVIQGLILYFAIEQFFTDTRSALFLTVLVGSIYWANMPGLGEGFFWLPAVVEYQLALALTILVFSLLAPSRARKSSNVWRITIGCLLAFLIP